MKLVLLSFLLLLNTGVIAQSTDIFKLIKKNDVEAVKKLLVLNKNAIAYLNNKRQTPLIYAAELNMPDIVSVLVKAEGVEIDVQDKKNNRALDYAKEHNNAQLIQQLETAEMEHDYFKLGGIRGCASFVERYGNVKTPYLDSVKSKLDSLIEKEGQEKGIVGLLRLETIVPDIWTKIKRYAANNGREVSGQEASDLAQIFESVATYSSEKSFSLLMYSGTIQTTTANTSKTTTLNYQITGLSFFEAGNFAFLQKATVDGHFYERLCIFKSSWREVRSFEVNF